MKHIFLYFFIFLLIPTLAFSQNVLSYKNLGELITIKSSYSMFPHINRNNGYYYKNIHYSFEDHYNDSTVKIFVPNYFKEKNKIDIIVHFHGWWNNIDSVIQQFNLIEQFFNSKKNAIFVFAQGPKNSPDSFGGKLELRDGFKKYIEDILFQLKEKRIIKKNNIGKIIISGHSGAYRVISYILQRGGLTNYIKEVFLFDALYGKIEKYVYWLVKSRGKLVVIYTDEGGTKEETEALIEDLNDWNIKHLAIQEEDLKERDLIHNRLIFIHTKLDHNQVLFKNNNFYNFIKASCLK